MSTLSKISIDITLSVVADPIGEPPKLATTITDQLRCEQFYSCNSKYCAKHGCRNALPRKSGEVRS